MANTVPITAPSTLHLKRNQQKLTRLRAIDYNPPWLRRTNDGMMEWMKDEEVRPELPSPASGEGQGVRAS
jgi:hypothetical protein